MRKKFERCRECKSNIIESGDGVICYLGSTEVGCSFRLVGDFHGGPMDRIAPALGGLEHQLLPNFV